VYYSDNLLFTAAGIILANSFLVLSYTWRLFMSIYFRLPVAFRTAGKFIFFLRLFRNDEAVVRQQREPAIILLFVWCSSLIIGISILLNILALVTFSARDIWSYPLGPNIESNYEAGKVLLAFSTICFASGVFFVGMARFWQFLALSFNRRSSIFLSEDNI